MLHHAYHLICLRVIIHNVSRHAVFTIKFTTKNGIEDDERNARKKIEYKFMVCLKNCDANADNARCNAEEY